MTTWALGVHPGQPETLAAFTDTAFRNDLQRAGAVGEVGLDARSRADVETQIEVLEAIAEAVSQTPRLVSIHSNGACERVLDVIARRPFRTPVLHWWRGTRAETEAAAQLGCFFSVNGTQPRALIERLPQDRVLTETDFPFTSRRDPEATRPGETSGIETKLAIVWGTPPDTTRRLIWQNLAAALPPESIHLLAPGWRQALKSLSIT